MRIIPFLTPPMIRFPSHLAIRVQKRSTYSKVHDYEVMKRFLLQARDSKVNKFYILPDQQYYLFTILDEKNQVS